LSRPVNLETTAIGAAFLAGLGTGVWKDTDAIRDAWKQERRFEPSLSAETVKAVRQRWHAAVAKA
jgi:glycerol kinase